jgi:hypothetical protein
VELYLYFPFVFMTCRRKNFTFIVYKMFVIIFFCICLILTVLGCYFNICQQIFNRSCAVSSGRPFIHVSFFLSFEQYCISKTTIEQRFMTAIFYSADTRCRCCAVSRVMLPSTNVTSYACGCTRKKHATVITFCLPSYNFVPGFA